MTDQPDDPYASPPPGWQPPPPAQPYGAPPPQYGAPVQPDGSPPQPYGAPPPPPYGAPPQPYGAPPQYAVAPYGTPYGQYAPGYQPSGYPLPSTTNGYAIAALTCSIVLAAFVGIGSILGVVFGIIGVRQCRQNNERGRGLAIAGIVIGTLGILFWLLALIGLLVDSSSGGDSSPTNIGTLGTVHSSTR